MIRWLALLVLLLVGVAQAQDCNFSLTCAPETGCGFVPDAANLDITGNFSFCAFIYPQLGLTKQGLLSHADGTPKGMELDIVSSGKLEGIIFNSTFWLVDGNTVVSLNTWHSTCFTYDGSQMCLYLDGAVDQCTPNTNNPGNPAGSDLIMGERFNATFPFTGRMNNMRVYNTALSGADVVSYSTGGNPTTGLISHWPLTEGTGTHFSDIVDANTGTIGPGGGWIANNPCVSTPTQTPSPSDTPTPTPTTAVTDTPSPTGTILTETPTPTSTNTPTPTPTPSMTPTPSVPVVGPNTCCDCDEIVGHAVCSGLCPPPCVLIRNATCMVVP